MHIAIADDCVCLALHSPAVGEPFKTALRQHPEAYRLGATTRKLGSGSLLAAAVREWPKGRSGERIATALGRVTHGAADAQFKAVFGRFGEKTDSGSRASMYEDLFGSSVFRVGNA